MEARFAEPRQRGVISNRQDDIALVEYNAFGNETRVVPVDPTAKPILEYTYNASQQRLSKKIIYGNGNTDEQFYAYDASGVLMATYSNNKNGVTNQPMLNDFMLYGSGRLGSYVVNEPIASANASADLQSVLTTKANLRFELSDHLGTVRAVITGEKENNGNAKVVSLTDYYPYGMDMPLRSYTAEAYRYGYQGSERDRNMQGGTGYTTFFRSLDPRLGRWLNPDPKKFPWQSPYCSMDCNPVALTDVLGDKSGGGEGDFTTGPSRANERTGLIGSQNNRPGAPSAKMSGYDFVVNSIHNYTNHISQKIENITPCEFKQMQDGVNKVLIEEKRDYLFGSAYDEKSKTAIFDLQSLIQEAQGGGGDPYSLYFNGSRLSIISPDGAGVFSVPAVSGRPDANGNFDYSRARQGMKGTGPLPAGKYYVNPQEMQHITEFQNAIGTVGGLFGMKVGKWPGGSYAWGEARVDIHGGLSTDRAGFTIHGGASWGSAGCIDTGPYIMPFLRSLCHYSNGATYIPLYVNYGN